MYKYIIIILKCVKEKQTDPTMETEILTNKQGIAVIIWCVVCREKAGLQRTGWQWRSFWWMSKQMCGSWGGGQLSSGSRAGILGPKDPYHLQTVPVWKTSDVSVLSYLVGNRWSCLRHVAKWNFNIIASLSHLSLFVSKLKIRNLNKKTEYFGRA